MPIVIGLFIIPIIVLIMVTLNMVSTRRKTRIVLHLLLIIIPVIYIVLCWIRRAEPFDFEIHYSLEYMFFSGEYILYSGFICLLTPFIWLIFAYYIRKIFRSLRIRKNKKIKREELVYYRGNLDQVSPAIISFTSELTVDIRKTISATILKLKLLGYIVEQNGSYSYTNQEDSALLESEKMVLRLIKTQTMDKATYKKVIEKETLQARYIRKNHGGKVTRLIKIGLAILLPILLFSFIRWFDQYIFDNYHVYPEDDGHTYIDLGLDDDIEKLYYEEMKDLNHYYHRNMADGSICYNYSEIRANQLQYSVVRKAFVYQIVGTLLVGFFFVFVLMSIYCIIEQVAYFNKNYTRTIKGKRLLTKAYALKNFLKDYSLIKDRREKELFLWEYYLIYALVLDVNVKIEDEIIERYVKDV